MEELKEEKDDDDGGGDEKMGTYISSFLPSFFLSFLSSSSFRLSGFRAA